LEDGYKETLREHSRRNDQLIHYAVAKYQQ